MVFWNLRRVWYLTKVNLFNAFSIFQNIFRILTCSSKEAKLVTPIVFYVTTADANDEIQRQFKMLTRLIFHHDIPECLAQIASLTETTIFMIISEIDFDEAILYTLKQLQQVHSIYISTFIAAEDLKETFSKVRCLCSHNDKELIVNQLKKDLVKYYRLKGDQYWLSGNMPLAHFCLKKSLNYS
jgi:hypothetical protein